MTFSLRKQFVSQALGVFLLTHRERHGLDRISLCNKPPSSCFSRKQEVDCLLHREEMTSFPTQRVKSSYLHGEDRAPKLRGVIPSDADVPSGSLNSQLQSRLVCGLIVVNSDTMAIPFINTRLLNRCCST